LDIKTHRLIDTNLCGEPVEIKSDRYAKVRLNTTDDMKVDDKGLIHGGFIFGAADYCAMICVNHPNVVLASSHVKFLKPSKVGDVLYFEARVLKKEDRKRIVKVIGYRQDKPIFEGEFLCVITEKHVLDR